MHHTSRIHRVLTLGLIFVLLSSVLRDSFFLLVFAGEESEQIITTISGEITSSDIIVSDASLSGTNQIDISSISGEIVLSDVIIDTTTGSQIESTGGVIGSGSELSGFCTGATDTAIEIANETTTKIVKEYIENIDTKNLSTGTASGMDREIPQELKEIILDKYMESTDKTKLTQDQMNISLPVSENQVFTILREAIENREDSDIRLFIRTQLDLTQLQELFGFFDTTTPYTFNEQSGYQDGTGTVYEMIFARESSLGKRIVNYLDAGVIPDNFFDQVEIIRPGFVYSLAGSGYLSGESDTLNWGISKIGAQTYQQLFQGKPRIKIGVIDTGVDITHPDLAANIYTNSGEIAGNNLDDDNNGYTDDVNGYSFVYNTGVVRDVHSHGTHVAGILGAAVNARGIYGVFSQAWIVPLKALGDTGNGTTYGISKAIRYAADNGIPIINMSLGGAGTPNQYDTLCAAITYARSKGTISVVSAGNNNVNVTGFSPSGCRDAIAVGALDSNLAKASFSNYGTGVNISAPGVSIYSTLPGGGYGLKSGTSMASPFVAGTIGAIFAMKGVLDLDQVRSILSQNGDTITTSVPMGVALNLTKIFVSLGISSNLSNPIITLSGASTMNIGLGSTWIDPGATCVDDVDITCTVTRSGSVNTALSGTYLITYSAVDHSGNLAIPLVRTIRVSDLTPPTITLSGASTLTLVVGTPFIDLGATCTDNYDSTCVVTRSGSVNTAIYGSYVLTYSSVDSSGNMAVDRQRVINIVATLGSPVITLSGASTMNIGLGSTFVDPGATCVDNIDITCTVTRSGSVNTALSGTYLITYSAIDNSGNLAIPLVRTVRVSDLTPPVITLSGASTMTLVVGTQFVDPGATCTDNYDQIGPRACVVTRQGEVNTSRVGSYILTYSSVDSSGNHAVDIQRTVNVVVSLVMIPPVITLSGASNVTLAIGSTWIDPGASCVDDVDSTCIVTTSGSVNTTLSGTYLITYFAVDSSGNHAISMVRTVRVSDLTPPHVTLSGASSITILLGSTFVDPGASCVDDVDVSCIVTTSGSVNTNQIGNYLLYYSAIDIAGNRSVILNRNISVYQIITSPVVTVPAPSTPISGGYGGGGGGGGGGSISLPVTPPKTDPVTPVTPVTPVIQKPIVKNIIKKISRDIKNIIPKKLKQVESKITSEGKKITILIRALQSKLNSKGLSDIERRNTILSLQELYRKQIQFMQSLIMG